MELYIKKINVFLKKFRSKGKPIDPIENIEYKPTVELAKSVAEQVNRIFLANLSADYPHLFEAQV